jgi:hypothetical protein
MADISPDSLDEASNTAILIEELIERLNAGNKERRSAIRSRQIVVLNKILADLDGAVVIQSHRRTVEQRETTIHEARRDYDHVFELTAWLQEAAQAEWSDQYAEYIEALGLIVEGAAQTRPLEYFRILSMPLIHQWLQSGEKLPVPDDMRQDYAALMMAWADGFLAYEAPKIQQVTSLGVLNTNDIPSLLGRALLASSAGRFAATVVTAYRARQRLARRAAEENEPGIVRTIWNVVGWDSFSDFAFDVGLIVVTGGGGAFLKWGKTLVKGARNLRHIRDGARLAGLTEDAAIQLKKVAKARDAIRLRLGAKEVGAAGRESLELAADRIQREYRRTLVRFIDAAISAVRSAAAKEELIKALRSGYDTLGKIGDAAASDRVLRELQAEGLISYQGKDPADITIEELEKVSAKLAVNSFEDLGSLISDAKDRALRAAKPPRTGNLSRLYLRWLYLLVTRQIIVRLIVLTASKRGRPPSRSDIVKITTKSVFAAIEESLIELWVPRGLVRRGVERLVRTTQKTVAELVSSAVAEVLD